MIFLVIFLIFISLFFQVREMFDVSQKIKILEASDIANSILYAVTQPDYCSINEILLEPREAPI